MYNLVDERYALSFCLGILRLYTCKQSSSLSAVINNRLIDTNKQRLQKLQIWPNTVILVFIIDSLAPKFLKL